ncbi:MAG: hypothetical protein KAJ57_04380, partial [Woeseiaceae bacterium]|nr:hypothetical protein [Woeseiaceae bacterium]
LAAHCFMKLVLLHGRIGLVRLKTGFATPSRSSIELHCKPFRRFLSDFGRNNRIRRRHTSFGSLASILVHSP